VSEPLFGIDFGTTYSAIAVSQDGSARIVEGPGGERLIPSLVYYGAQGETLVGEQALMRGLSEPDRAISNVKRLIGRPFESRVVQEFRLNAPYIIEPDDQGNCTVRVGERRYFPGEVVTAVFAELRDRARRATGVEKVSAVVTAPAHFADAQRRAIQTAATDAGIDVMRILTEPTAASIAYGGQAQTGERLLIFDLGGGTLDVTVLRIDEDVHEILAVGGHPLLGGVDFDHAICEEAQMVIQTGVGVLDDPVTHRRLLHIAEMIKRGLSELESEDRVVPDLVPGKDVRLTYTRSSLDLRIGRLVDRAAEIAENVLRDSGLHKEEIDSVLLVGGSTRVPRVRQVLEERFGPKLSHAVQPQEAVALGAATFAASLGTADAMVLLDVLPASVGIAGPGGKMVPLLTRNSLLPCDESFEVNFGGSETRQVTIYQGEHDKVTENEALGVIDMVVEGAPVNAAEVTIRADGEGLVTVSAFDPSLGQLIRTQFRLFL